MNPVIFSVLAENDLEQIGDYIARDSPHRALSFIRQLRVQCQKLQQFPKSHRRFPELGPTAHIMPYGKYVVLYRVMEEYVSIERILHGSRDILPLIAG
jgi:toxin ParE1/3/4